MPPIKPPVAIARSRRGEWAIADAAGARIVGRSASAAVAEIPERTVCLFRDQSAARELLEAAIRWALAKGRPLPAIGLRSSSSMGAGMAIATAALDGGRLLLDGSLHLSDDDADLAPIGAFRYLIAEQIDSRDDLREACQAALELCATWQAEVADLGLSPRLAAGSTAAQLVPQRWVRAMARHRKDRPDDLPPIDATRYGGRVECFQPGWSGEAIEYDLRSAYGAAMIGALGALPGPQLYDVGRDPLPEQPAWYTVTVRVEHDVAPLPMRDHAQAWRVHWPTSGEWTGSYTAAELAQPGVQIVKTHRVQCGRYDHDLEAPVAALLEQRESAGPWRRAVVRQLLVSLAGKLAQRAEGWRLWVPTGPDPRPPAGLVQLGGLESLVMAYPVSLPIPGYVVPQAHSYLTSRVRVELANVLRACPQRLYCDTDSIHLPADAPPPPGIGSDAGTWAAKTQGPAYYRGRRSYRIGSKRVGIPD